MSELKMPKFLYDDNSFFQNALEETCMYCKARHEEATGLYDCWHDHKDDCPYRCEIEQIEMWCEELLKMTADVRKQSRELDDNDFDRETYEADLRYKSERETPEKFGLSA